MERIIITARDGFILTDGEIYGVQIYLAVNKSPSDFYEITEEEYNKLMEMEGR